MKRRRYTKKEQQELQQNKNVLSCTDKTITYSEDFKRFVLKRYYEDGNSPRDLFAEQGFPESIVDSEIPRSALKTWRKTYGEAYEKLSLTSLKGKGGGRPPKSYDVSTMTDQEKLAYYEAKVAYIEKENDFLAQARGLKRWLPFDRVAGKDLSL
jgi:transposase